MKQYSTEAKIKGLTKPYYGKVLVFWYLTVVVCSKSGMDCWLMEKGNAIYFLKVLPRAPCLDQRILHDSNELMMVW